MSGAGMPLRICVHPGQVMERRGWAGGWRRRREGRRWRLRHHRPYAVDAYSCPDCPATGLCVGLDPGMVTHYRLPPWVHVVQ